MKLGLQIPNFTWPGGPAMLSDTFGRIVESAEAAGFYSLWVMDHFFQLGQGRKEQEMLEAYTTLGYAAGLTQRIKLGTMVTGVTYRHPGLLVKTVTTLDVLSRGRAYLGIGAAWNEEEHTGLGVPFPPLKERFELLEETLQVAHQMWAADAKPFDGKHLHLAEPLNVPPALSRPHPPILIGSSGEEKTFRLIAKYGDACNIFAVDPATVAHKYEVLRLRCEEVGRAYTDIEKTILGTMVVTSDGRPPAGLPPMPWPVPTMTPTQAIEWFHQFAELGTDHAIFGLPLDAVPGTFDLWASEIIPAVEKIVPAGR
ncbi:MAG: LLM class F420-dependent oxidoreductase [Actinomycetota bacterium]|nr:LLM class F420-dependent oxidoreductase [Actinomycetota bacterium]